MHRIGINWTVGLSTGWGVYGTNLALELARRSLCPVLLDCAAQLDLSPLAAARLRPQLEAYRAGKGARGPLDFPVLQALGDRLLTPERVGWHPGRPNVGVVFLEHVDIPAERLAALKDWPLIVAGSSWNAEVLRRQGLDNVALCPQGVDPALFHPAPRRDLFPDRFLVFSGGKFEYRKGQDIVLAAFRAFRQRHAEAVLVTAWTNLWPDSVATMAQSPHVGGLPEIAAGGALALAPWLAANGVDPAAVVDLGMIRNRLLPQILLECDLAVFPNRCEGGTNLAAMEAMACGVPVILSANTGHLDLLGSHAQALTRQAPVPGGGTEGWGESDVEEVLEAMEAAWRDRAASRARGAAAAGVMAGWSWSRQIDRLLAALEPVSR